MYIKESKNVTGLFKYFQNYNSVKGQDFIPIRC